MIGKTFSEKMESLTRVGEGSRGKISICIFDQLAATAEKRLFGFESKA